MQMQLSTRQTLSRRGQCSGIQGPRPSRCIQRVYAFQRNAKRLKYAGVGQKQNGKEPLVISVLPGKQWGWTLDVATSWVPVPCEHDMPARQCAAKSQLRSAHPAAVPQGSAHCCPTHMQMAAMRGACSPSLRSWPLEG